MHVDAGGNFRYRKRVAGSGRAAGDYGGAAKRAPKALKRRI